MTDFDLSCANVEWLCVLAAVAFSIFATHYAECRWESQWCLSRRALLRAAWFPFLLVALLRVILVLFLRWLQGFFACFTSKQVGDGFWEPLGERVMAGFAQDRELEIAPLYAAGWILTLLLLAGHAFSRPKFFEWAYDVLSPFVDKKTRFPRTFLSLSASVDQKTMVALKSAYNFLECEEVMAIDQDRDLREWILNLFEQRRTVLVMKYIQAYRDGYVTKRQIRHVAAYEVERGHTVHLEALGRAFGYPQVREMLRALADGKKPRLLYKHKLKEGEQPPQAEEVLLDESGERYQLLELKRCQRCGTPPSAGKRKRKSKTPNDPQNYERMTIEKLRGTRRRHEETYLRFLEEELDEGERRTTNSGRTDAKGRTL